MGDVERTRLGKYTLVKPLAEGGMARLYLAKTSGIGSFERHLVVKLILRERAGDSNAVKMLLDEARLAATLNHHNVAQVYEVGEDDGLYYLAMEYVHGLDLRALLAASQERARPLPLPFALTIIANAAAGLHHAHERRGANGAPLLIVHRDVSPSNVMVGYDGAVKLVDFGLAKAAQRSAETRTGIVKGKLAYLSPEQARGQPADRRSDVFALGIVLYECTTMKRAFRGRTDFETMQNVATGTYRRPSALVPSYPRALEAVIARALAVDPAQRTPTAADVLHGIEQVAAEQRIALSNVALGRFMLDMFGEVPEPWVDAPSVPPPPSRVGRKTGPAIPAVAIAPAPASMTPSDPGGWSRREGPPDADPVVASPRTLPPDRDAMARAMAAGRIGYATGPRPKVSARSSRRWWILAIIVVAALVGGAIAFLQAR
jgi:serine/threonine protein kinase